MVIEKSTVTIARYHDIPRAVRIRMFHESSGAYHERWVQRNNNIVSTHDSNTIAHKDYMCSIRNEMRLDAHLYDLNSLGGMHAIFNSFELRIDLTPLNNCGVRFVRVGLPYDNNYRDIDRIKETSYSLGFPLRPGDGVHNDTIIRDWFGVPPGMQNVGITLTEAVESFQVFGRAARGASHASYR